MTKKCSRCRKTKPIDEFSRKGEAWQHVCKICARKASATYYRDNREAHLVRVRANNKRHRQQLRDLVLAAKKDVPCKDCGRVYPPCVMDFDHIRGQKVTNIGKMIGPNSNHTTRARLLEEIAKCELVCANCHRIRTFHRMNAASAVTSRSDCEVL